MPMNSQLTEPLGACPIASRPRRYLSFRLQLRNTDFRTSSQVLLISVFVPLAYDVSTIFIFFQLLCSAAVPTFERHSRCIENENTDDLCAPSACDEVRILMVIPEHQTQSRRIGLVGKRRLLDVQAPTLPPDMDIARLGTAHTCGNFPLGFCIRMRTLRLT